MLCVSTTLLWASLQRLFVFQKLPNECYFLQLASYLFADTVREQFPGIQE